MKSFYVILDLKSVYFYVYYTLYNYFYLWFIYLCMDTFSSYFYYRFKCSFINDFLIHFLHFRQVNKYISALRNVNDSYEFTHCECLLTSENPCGPGSECINRMLQIECDKTCRAQDKCQNQRFQRCQQVDCVPLKTAHCGWGLKTRQGSY